MIYVHCIDCNQIRYSIKITTTTTKTNEINQLNFKAIVHMSTISYSFHLERGKYTNWLHSTEKQLKCDSLLLANKQKCDSLQADSTQENEIKCERMRCGHNKCVKQFVLRDLMIRCTLYEWITRVRSVKSHESPSCYMKRSNEFISTISLNLFF